MAIDRTDTGAGVYDGDENDNLIDAAAAPDADGDIIDGGDASLPGEVGDDDIANAGDGNDTVSGGAGDDELFGGAGDDELNGGAGDDLLAGDRDINDNIGGGESVREAFRWSEATDPDGADGSPGIDDGDALNGFTLNTGNVDVTFSSVTTGADNVALFEDNFHLVTGVVDDDTGINPNSALGNVLFSPADTSEFTLDFSNPVENVSFRINDIDADSVVTLTAIGPDGPITVNLTPGANITLSDNDAVAGAETAEGDGDQDADVSLLYSILVDIPGPVSQITVEHSTNGVETSGIKITDVYFDAVPVDAVPVIAEGDDTLNGEEGDDILIGEGGDDVLTGGAGADDMQGGDGRDTFIIDDAADGVGDNADGGSGGDDFDTLDLTGAGDFSITDSTEDPDGNSISGTVNFLDASGSITGSMAFQEIERIIPCFTPGTKIATPKGERLVEDLEIGDKVITRDNGLQEIRWVGRRDLAGRELLQAPQMKPILIRAGALGRNLPETDLLVSPNHRVLINNEKSALYFEDREVLVAAKHLTDLEGVDAVDTDAVTYIHFMFDQHEVVLSNGSWTESFQPGEQTLGDMDAEQREEIFMLFPELRDAEGIAAYQAARRSLKKYEAKLLTK